MVKMLSSLLQPHVLGAEVVSVRRYHNIDDNELGAPKESEALRSMHTSKSEWNISGFSSSHTSFQACYACVDLELLMEHSE